MELVRLRKDRPVARRPRLSAQETVDRTIEAGLDLLLSNGLSLGLDAINLEQAVRDSDVSRSSAYAGWNTDERFSPQELFQRTVLKRAVAERRETIELTHQSAHDVLAASGASLSGQALLRELGRVTGGANALAVANSRSWQLVVALRAVLNSATEQTRDPELAEWVAESEAAFRQETIETVYRPIAEIVGIQPREQYGDAAFDLAEIAASALAEGLAPRYFMLTAPHLQDLVHPGQPADEPWSLFSLVFEQIVMRFFEPVDPESWESDGD